ncbi:MAG: D-alanyl-D-alanine carboxypeptidase [Oscillospiraceae bacterium]|jgi:D-alanyl-D-alanine carboxypeptidase (penicillin-binding protein 5/6)|nr:D-alanyl-D-alanine carboxypeptidase [Oscillospiraceae bacterium]
MKWTRGFAGRFEPRAVTAVVALFALMVGITGFAPASAETIDTSAPLEAKAPFDLQTPSYLLMEAKTGKVIFEKNADERRPVASVTKLMTILLVLEELDRGVVKLTDSVFCSANAAGMGGSQALLDANVQYPLEELLKSTIVASANDSAVALAEYLNGSEDAFVKRMNDRAAQLGMTNTHYVNVTGLPAANQYTSARDVATVSRAVGQHPTFFKYSTIWMDSLKHPSGRVTDLTNTNRLIRFYEGADGFKTGSTNEAKYCLSATAARGSTRMIAVILGTPASQTRFDEARKLLEYGFANYQLNSLAKKGDLIGADVAVRLGAQSSVAAAVGSDVELLLGKGKERDLKLDVTLADTVPAPVRKGDVIGEVRVMLADELLMALPAVAASDVPYPGYLEAIMQILNNWKI